MVNEQTIGDQEEILSIQKNLIAANDEEIAKQDDKIAKADQDLTSINNEVILAQETLQNTNARVAQDEDEIDSWKRILKRSEGFHSRSSRN